MEITPKKIDDEIRAIRAIMRISQEEFAKKVGVTKQTVYNWERAVGKPDADQIDKIRAFVEKGE
jgi:DNA-binding transcriptional regulator YiaG